MARRSNVEEVEVPAEETPAKETKAKGPKRGDLPEGFATPVGFAKEISEREMQVNRAGETITVPPQMVYSYIRNARKDDPFPVQEVKDSNDVDRKVVNVEEGVAWWTRKNERANARKTNAAEKASKKEAKAEAAAQAEEAE